MSEPNSVRTAISVPLSRQVTGVQALVKTATIVGVLLLMSVVGWIFIRQVCGNDPAGDWRIETASPDGVYLVRVEGEVSPSITPFSSHGDHKATFSLFKQGTPIITHEQLYGGDALDNLFLTLYPAYEWTSTNTLRFGEKNTIPESQQDEILVSNNTDDYLKYVRVNFGGDELFIVIELPPKQTIHLHAEPQTDQYSDFSGITCVAGKAGPYLTKRAEFNIRGKYKAPAHYFIEIETSDITIKSQEFEPIK